ncbi:MAG TPA: helix-turn-helix transcriptional regulator [Shinella sp.]|jgi:DNA-binding transcriptional ArsR family regulator|nr:helix-turn-helix transcriptional regulator [Shinella sp.]
MADRLPQPARENIDLGVVFSTLSDPLRRTAIAILATLPDDAERNCVSFGFPVAKASLTHHFKILREAGLISQIDYGNRRASSLRREDIEARFPGLLALLVEELARDGGAEKAVASAARR